MFIFTFERVLLNPPSTDHFPHTHRPADYLPTDPPTGRHQLSQNRRPDSKYVLESQILQSFLYQLVQFIT